MKTLNLVMIVKNEERCLERCLAQVKDLVDDMIIVDTGSEDRTVEIARSFGARVYTYDWINDFSAARNFALKQSDSDWNLVLDADEYLVQGSREDLTEFLENTSQIGEIAQRQIFMDHEEVTHSTFHISRILPRGVYYRGRIHEQPDSDFPIVSLPLLFEHDGYIEELKKTERNLPYLLRELEDAPNSSYLLYKAACSHHKLKQEKEALACFERFYQSVPLRASYREEGIVFYLYALMDLEQYQKALELVKKEELRLENSVSFQFACGIFYMKLVLFDTAKYVSYLPKIEQCYLKCLCIGENPHKDAVIGLGSFKAAYNLGTWYEVSGNLQKAKESYQMAAKQGYAPARERLLKL